MHKKLISALLLLAASSGAMADNVPGLTVEYLNSNTPAYTKAISTIGRLTFSGGNATLEFADNSTANLGALTDIKQIRFAEVDEKNLTPNTPVTPPDGIADAQVRVKVYPNPTANRLTVEGIAEGETVRLFNANGQQVLKATETTIDMSQFTAGDYLLQVGANVVKVVKK
ncbi:MAG: T9SS type A sorting domain-containing protein [Salinivirgaceae bacterium]|nr:T9SS type A sorting domain-containing protein [Salinivirgaceae bacterium]